MNLNKFTEKAQEAVVAAQNLATEQSHAEVTPEHLLVALITQRDGIVPSVLRKMNIDPGKAGTDARALLSHIAQAYDTVCRVIDSLGLQTNASPVSNCSAGVLDMYTIVQGYSSRLAHLCYT